MQDRANQMNLPGQSPLIIHHLSVLWQNIRTQVHKLKNKCIKNNVKFCLTFDTHGLTLPTQTIVCQHSWNSDSEYFQHLTYTECYDFFESIKKSIYILCYLTFIECQQRTSSLSPTHFPQLSNYTSRFVEKMLFEKLTFGR